VYPKDGVEPEAPQAKGPAPGTGKDDVQLLSIHEREPSVCRTVDEDGGQGVSSSSLLATHLMQDAFPRTTSLSGPSPPSSSSSFSSPASFEAFLMRDVPYDYLCPVSFVLLTDPVVAADGITYQRCVTIPPLSDY
jgi:hypothetical protein